jgi:cytoskeletal protein CcmA (bactofilin family)
MKVKGEGAGDLDGFLDAASSLEGELRFENTFRVDGRLKGKVISSGDLIVGRDGVVEAEIHVGRLYVSGTVRGSALAAQRIEIASGARVEADVETPTLIVEEGAHFQGRCAMDKRPARAEIPNPAASAH